MVWSKFSRLKLNLPHLHAIQVGVIALYVFCAAVIGRVLSYVFVELPAWFPWYLGLELVYLVLFILVILRPGFPKWSLYVYFVLQSVIIVYLISLPPHLDFLTALFIMLSYQVALILPGKSRWIWIGIFCVLVEGSLIYWLGWLHGLAYSMTPIAGNIIFPTYVIAYREEDQANQRRQSILRELQEKHRQLEVRANQVEEISAIKERNRLARELHDSVSQTMFSIILNTRATQILLDREANRVRPQLEQLQILTQDALSEMRSLIAQLRPQ
jgi:signal transduction histidine kinase